MIALGMILLLSYFFVRKTIGFTDPIDRSYLPFFFLGSGFMLVETKAITELGLHLGGTWFVIAAAIMLVLVMAFLANLIVTRSRLQAGRGRLFRFVRKLADRICSCDQPRPVDVRPAVDATRGKLPCADDSAVLRRHHLLQPDREAGNQYLHGICLQPDGRAYSEASWNTIPCISDLRFSICSRSDFTPSPGYFLRNRDRFFSRRSEPVARKRDKHKIETQINTVLS